MNNNKEMIEVKKCKKCGCELASDTKGNLCLNCKKKKGKLWRHVFEGAGTVASVALLIVTLGRKK